MSFPKLEMTFPLLASKVKIVSTYDVFAMVNGSNQGTTMFLNTGQQEDNGYKARPGSVSQSSRPACSLSQKTFRSKRRDRDGKQRGHRFGSHQLLTPDQTFCFSIKGILHQKIFYRPNLIFWIVMGCGIARFGRRGLKTTET